MRKARRSGFVTFVLAFAILAVAALALAIPGLLIGQAGAVTVPSTVTISYNPTTDFFRGAVKATRSGCEQKRTVSLFKVQPGADIRRGGDVTGAGGRYGVSVPGANGRFYVKVARKVVSGYNHKFVCESARSAAITVG